ncbi:diaminopimelate decarboxylase [Kitasatospora sp. MAP5-34]|nr:diaminopimelate decarboxylase [Kitasatospora sp. MAP5-34]
MTITPVRPHLHGDPSSTGLGNHWPVTARLEPGGELTVGGVSLADTADRFGTPLYVLDETEIRARCRAYRAALPDAEVFYAAKAFLCSALAGWIAEADLGLDVCSEGELRLATAAGFPRERILLHGNAKSPEELRLARRLRVGRFAIDNLAEIPRLAALAIADAPQRVLVRVVPGVAAGHHEVVRTGVTGQKFGFAIEGGDSLEAVRRVRDQPGLILSGLHCHLGSQISSVEPYLTAVDRLIELLAEPPPPVSRCTGSSASSTPPTAGSSPPSTAA